MINMRLVHPLDLKQAETYKDNASYFSDERGNVKDSIDKMEKEMSRLASNPIEFNRQHDLNISAMVDEKGACKPAREGDIRSWFAAQIDRLVETAKAEKERAKALQDAREQRNSDLTKSVEGFNSLLENLNAAPEGEEEASVDWSSVEKSVEEEHHQESAPASVPRAPGKGGFGGKGGMARLIRSLT